ncbi:MAG TPA: NAD(P)/FAD-dependent oxidoreductase [Thermoanaerobaculia bacterium]
MPDFDFVAVGGGNTGLTASYRIAAAGKRVALVDRGPVGGLCSLAGCNPKKVLVRATEVLDEVRRSGEHGIDAPVRGVDWRKVIARKRTFTQPVPDQTEAALKKAGVERIRGTARFVSPEAMRVDGRELSSGGFLIATGSTPRPLAFPGGNLAKTTDEILELEEPPDSLVIIGAGVVAFEFGQVFARLGSSVSVLMPSDRALRGADETLVDALVMHSMRLGMEFFPHTGVKRIVPADGRLSVEGETSGKARTWTADFVLNAAGRVPNLESLDLSAAGVASDKRGVLVDSYLRSPGNRRVFAGGDAHGSRQLSPVASYEGRIVAKNFLEGDVETVSYESIPQAVYTVPPLAWVGATEAEAREKGPRIIAPLYDKENWRVFAIAGERPAMSKVIVEESTKRILGAHLLGASAAEVIHVFAMAMRFGLTTTDLEKMVWAYPTFTSVLDSTWK